MSKVYPQRPAGTFHSMGFTNSPITSSIKKGAGLIVNRISIFLAVGLLGLIVDLTAFHISIIWLPELWARVFSIKMAIVATWLGNRLATFGYKKHHPLWLEYLLYLAASVLGAVVNYVSFLAIIHQHPDIDRAVAIIGSSAIAAVVNFLTYQFIVFPQSKGESN